MSSEDTYREKTGDDAYRGEDSEDTYREKSGDDD